MGEVIKVDEEEDCVATVRGLIGTRRFIRVNGHSGAGKTRIAKALAKEFGWERVSLDDFIDERGEPDKYCALVNATRVRDAILAGMPGVIVEGIWLDQIVPVDSFGPELKIYVRACYPPQLDADEVARRRQFRTHLYHKRHRPEFWADLTIMKIVIP